MKIIELLDFIKAHPRLLVLTGAGISAASGIPTYRDEKGKWQRSQPIQHQEFTREIEQRRRYWARSAIGWPILADAKPNRAHKALAKLEAEHYITLLATQNVDRLHQQAGHRHVIDLHGRLDRVRCLQCDHLENRHQVQKRLLADNPGLLVLRADSAPDGDALLDKKYSRQIKIPDCPACHGTLMPDVVFFGASVPAQRVVAVKNALQQSDALLVIGSSLMVYSGFRFCKFAQQFGKPIAAINQGQTRADELLSVKLEMDCGDALESIMDNLQN